MLNDFKEFAIKGNVVDMAVGLILGAAFTAIVKSLVDDVLMPLLGLLTGGVDFSRHFWLLKAGKTAPPYETVDAAHKAGAIVIGYGRLLNVTLSFVLVALCLFFVVRWINHLRRPDTPPAPSTKPCPFCKSSVDQDASRCAFCTSELEPLATGD